MIKQLSSRDVQEENSPLINNYSLQRQADKQGLFLDQSHTLFDDGGDSKQRKRARRVAVTSQMNPLISMQQPHPSQLIDLTQLHEVPPQPNVVSTGLQLSSGEQQQILFPRSPVSILSENLASLIKQHIVEIDHYVQGQSEQLRRTLAEKRQGNYRMLLVAAEELAAKRLREKEEEVEKASRRNADLEARAAQLTTEAQTWQMMARTQEAEAATLQAQLRIVMTTGGGCAAKQQEREKGRALGSAVGEAEDAESAFVDPDRVAVSTGPSCKACGKRIASVVVLPCRHLCLCTVCDSAAQACPLCLSIISCSIEILLC